MALEAAAALRGPALLAATRLVGGVLAWLGGFQSATGGHERSTLEHLKRIAVDVAYRDALSEMARPNAQILLGRSGR